MHVAQFVIVTLATVLEPKIWLSHCKDRVTFCLQSLNTRICESIRHYKHWMRLFFWLPYFGFCTSAFSTCTNNSPITSYTTLIPQSNSQSDFPAYVTSHVQHMYICYVCWAHYRTSANNTRVTHVVKASIAFRDW